MAKDSSTSSISPREHIRQLVDWMSQGVYEKEQIIAVALLCAVAGENMFLLGPPGTAKSMVASRLKRVFKDGKSFDYLMSRFSTPDEIFGPIAISRLKNEDRYERLTAGYLPDADVVFLDEIWKAGPSIQNTLLTIVNEHIFHNGGQIMHCPMKVLIAASNELPAKDEGLEALWDRFLVRMVSNCIEDEDSFFKMIMSMSCEQSDLADDLFITDELYARWQSESKAVGINESVINAIRALRKAFADLEKEDGNKLRYYISDRRWRKAYRLMQTSAYLNGRTQINMSDYLLLIHSFWNDVECIPNVLNAICSSISDATIKSLNQIECLIRDMMTARKVQSTIVASRINEVDNLEEYDYFYYLIENYPDGDAYFSKWDYTSLNNTPRDGIIYFDTKRKKNIIHAMMPGKTSDNLPHNVSNLRNLKLQRSEDGIIIDGAPYFFRRKDGQRTKEQKAIEDLPLQQRITTIQDLLQENTTHWEKMVTDCFTVGKNIFLSKTDIALVDKTIKNVRELVKTTGVKLNNVAMMIK